MSVVRAPGVKISDIAALKELGVAEIFKPGARTTDIVDWVKTNVGARD